MLSILVPGGSGQLGRDLAALAVDSIDATTPSSSELDVRDTGQVVAAVTELAARARAAGTSPVVINAAAYTAVDAAETDEERAFAVNADGPRVLAAACSSRGVPLIHVSTDYVFAGDATSPYETTDLLGPLNAYGRTKAAGEDALLGSGARSWIVRTSWVYGKTGANFVKTMARLEKEREELSVVDDQTGSPTWSRDLAAGRGNSAVVQGFTRAGSAPSSAKIAFAKPHHVVDPPPVQCSTRCVGPSPAATRPASSSRPAARSRDQVGEPV